MVFPGEVPDRVLRLEEGEDRSLPGGDHLPSLPPSSLVWWVSSTLDRRRASLSLVLACLLSYLGLEPVPLLHALGPPFIGKGDTTEVMRGA